MRLIQCAIMFKAEKCLKVMVELELGIDYAEVLMIKLMADNFMHPSETISSSIIKDLFQKLNGHNLEKVIFGLIMSN